MKLSFQYKSPIIRLTCFCFLLLKVSLSAYSQGSKDPDSNKVDLRFPYKESNFNPYSTTPERKLFLENPSNIKSEVEYNPETGQYNFSQKVGDSIKFRNPTYMTFDEYQDYENEKAVKEYWREKASGDSAFSQKSAKNFRPSLTVPGEGFDRIFGGNTVDIRPSGSAELIFGVNISKTENPQIPERQRRITTFDFNEKIQLNVIGNIGEKLKLTTNYNTEATFDFENQMKLEYTGYDDEIIQKIELGNVTLPLSGSLITGSQSLFGVKTQLKFGRLTVTSVYSQQRGEKSEIEVKGGAQISEFELKADSYEANRHFFLSQFFRDNYERSVTNPPFIGSGINILRVEVWVTNTNFNTNNTRNIVAFQDLGEPNVIYNETFANTTFPNLPASNNANNIYNDIRNDVQLRGFTNSSNRLNALGLQSRLDYQKVELARQLTETEYTLQTQLGYISLNQQLQPNQVLSVAYQYTFNGQTYQVGEFSTDGINGSDALFLKMLKSTELNTKIPMWDLMMKNVYNIGAYQVERQGFRLNIWYLSQETGVDVNYIAEGPIDRVPLIQVMGLDKVNVNGQATPDGVFDYLDNPLVTINSNNGRVYFPVLEPFGQTLRDALNNTTLADKYAFDSLYTVTQANAQYNFPDKNRFTIKGTYESSSQSDISLGAFNIPEGSVTVTAGGAQLIENQDFTVDYSLGRVKILNQSIMESGTPIKIALESNSLFNIQSKALFASRFDYKFSDNFTLGGTIMNLTERPLTQKVNIGNEPISNTVVGIDGNFSTESQLMTTLVDKIPLIDTKEKSSITVSGEVAKLIPGHSKAIGKGGVSYIDDFEGSQSTIDLRSFTTWVHASTPQGQPDLFPEGSLTSDLAFNYNRARFAWYVVDPLFYRNNNLTPDHIKNDAEMQSNHFMREIFESEVFPNREFAPGQFTNIPMFDLAFYPEERGIYNYDVNGQSLTGASFGYGLNANGSLKRPEERWGGIMRRIETNDFDAANIEFIQFWLMDPYAEEEAAGFPGSAGNETDGALYFNIGNISEDILRDGIKSFENGLPTTEAGSANLAGDTLTPWGRVPSTQQIVNAFDNDPASRPFQDAGMDGLRTIEERIFFQEAYLDRIANDGTLGTGSQAFTNANQDPAADDYNYFRDDDYDDDQLNILERYKLYNGMEGNSPSAEQSSNLNGAGYPTSATTIPNVEDINRDNTLDEVESYYQYRVDVSKRALNVDNVGRNFITDVLTTTVTTKDNQKREVNWYQIKIPIREFEKQVGNISDFRSIRFMRMYMRGFEKPVFLRFARLELVRGEWRRFLGDLDEEGPHLVRPTEQNFDIAAVNIEENSSKKPVNYVLPPAINREVAIGTANLQQLNEQSLSLNVCDLKDGSANAAYRNVNFDVRSYKKLQMFVHAEAADPDQILNDGDVTVFIRLGTDFTENYYEYELPPSITAPGTYDPNSFAGKEGVWPLENEIDIEFRDLHQAKAARNLNIARNGGAALRGRYMVDLGAGRKVYVVGNPNLSDVKTIMIGVRNPIKSRNPNDDGQPKCAEVWVNELRLTEFDEQGGWATIGRVTARMADFATFSVSGGLSTPGWGSIDKKVSERQRETLKNFDASTTIELGKFLPEKTGLKVPMYLGYSEQISNPQFAPSEPDTPMEDFLAGFETSKQDSAKRSSQAFTKRRSVNFTNVRKERTNSEGKPHFYDVENLSATYSYSEVFMRDYTTEFNKTRNVRGGLSYNHSAQPKNFKPFSKFKPVRRSKWLRLIKDFNFYLTPKQLSFRSDLNRVYTEQKTRNTTPGLFAPLPIFVDKTFTWDRNYSVSHDITKSLKFDFTANNRALIEEFVGEQVSRERNLGGYIGDSEDAPINDERSYDLHKERVWNSIRDFGQNLDYNHQANLNYTIPFNKFPMTDWITSTARYSATYQWVRAPFAADSLKHTISNSNQLSLNGTLRMTSLYNKIGYLRKINQKRPPRRNQAARPKPPVNEADTTKNGKPKKEKDPGKLTVVERGFKFLMSVKSLNATFSQSRGTSLPGYNLETRVIGMDPGLSAPGVGFLFGQQDKFGPNRSHFAEYAGNEKEWLAKVPGIATQYTRGNTKSLNLRASIEPIRDLKINLTATRMKTQQMSEFWQWDPDTLNPEGELGWFSGNSPQETGNFSISVLTWRTAFVKDNSDNINSVYEKFLENRRAISGRLSDENPNSGGGHAADAGYSDGYGQTQQDVLIPAFLAAYSGQGANGIGLSPFINIPKPNWRITYNGLSKVKLFQKYFKTVTLNHGYVANFNVSQYTKNINEGQYGLNGENFVPEFAIAAVSISEQFSPLVNVDVQWASFPSLSTRFELKRDRTLTLSMANAQLTEVSGKEVVIGAGYTLKEIPFFAKIGGKRPTSNLVLRTDVSFRNTQTVIRRIVEDNNQPTAGSRIITIKITADYQLTQQFNIRAFYDRVVNNPVISNSFPTANTNAGVSLRFTLSG